jgi:predicted PurR-regulated permease PerM
VAEGNPSNGTVARIVLIVLSVLLLAYGVYLVRQVLVLVVVALFLAIGLDPVVRALQRFRFPRGAAVATVFVVALLFIAGFVASVTPPLVRQTVRLAEQIPDFAEELSDRSGRFADLDRRYDISDRLRSAVNNLPELAAGSAGSVLGVAKSVGRAFFSILTVTVLTIYFMLDLPKLIAGGAKLLARSRRERTQKLADLVFKRISGYMIGQVGVSLFAGVMSLIVLNVLGVPYALPLAMWVSLAALIPMVGATLGAIAPVIVAFFDGTGTGIATVIFFLLYQQFENYIVQPRVMKQAVDISAAAVLLAALVGGTLLGFVGALLAIPMAASIKAITQEVWLPRQEAA